ncbi:hypothetical protein MOD25_05550 [Bacillus haynesii]|uniref:hypothetical protein n=1 Tax=Bacillus haynesii TaxID=1925021 RepID=UPI00227DC353|nr:hypothetical protein [Bacillus haynesii]MCY8549366.1 hypothetical protein [Bacillus haynesii]
MKNKKMKSVVLAVGLAGALVGGTVTYAATNWFDQLKNESVASIQAPNVDYKKTFQSDLDKLKSALKDEASDLVEENNQNLKYDLNEYKKTKTKDMEKKVIGEKLKEIRTALESAEAKALENGKAKIDTAYEQVLQENGF